MVVAVVAPILVAVALGVQVVVATEVIEAQYLPHLAAPILVAVAVVVAIVAFTTAPTAVAV